MMLKQRERENVIPIFNKVNLSRERERDCEMLFIFYQSKDVTDTHSCVIEKSRNHLLYKSVINKS